MKEIDLPFAYVNRGDTYRPIYSDDEDFDEEMFYNQNDNLNKTRSQPFRPLNDQGKFVNLESLRLNSNQNDKSTSGQETDRSIIKTPPLPPQLPISSRISDIGNSIKLPPREPRALRALSIQNRSSSNKANQTTSGFTSKSVLTPSSSTLTEIDDLINPISTTSSRQISMDIQVEIESEHPSPLIVPIDKPISDKNDSKEGEEGVNDRYQEDEEIVADSTSKDLISPLPKPSDTDPNDHLSKITNQHLCEPPSTKTEEESDPTTPISKANDPYDDFKSVISLTVDSAKKAEDEHQLEIQRIKENHKDVIEQMVSELVLVEERNKILLQEKDSCENQITQIKNDKEKLIERNQREINKLQEDNRKHLWKLQQLKLEKEDVETRLKEVDQKHIKDLRQCKFEKEEVETRLRTVNGVHDQMKIDHQAELDKMKKGEYDIQKQLKLYQDQTQVLEEKLKLASSEEAKLVTRLKIAHVNLSRVKEEKKELIEEKKKLATEKAEGLQLIQQRTTENCELSSKIGQYTTDIRVFNNEISKYILKEQDSQTREKDILAKHKTKENQLSSKIRSLEIALAAEKKTEISMIQHLSQVAQFKQQNEDLNSTISMLNQTISNLEQQLETEKALKIEGFKAKASLIHLKEENEKLRLGVNNAKKELEEANRTIKVEKKIHENDKSIIEDNKNELQKLKTENQALIQKLAGLSQDVEKSNKDYQNSKNEIMKLQTENQIVVQKSTELSEEIEKGRKDHEKNSEMNILVLEKAQSSIATLQAQLSEKEDELVRLNDQLSKVNEEYKDMEIKYGDLRGNISQSNTPQTIGKEKMEIANPRSRPVIRKGEVGTWTVITHSKIRTNKESPCVLPKSPHHLHIQDGLPVPSSSSDNVSPSSFTTLKSSSTKKSISSSKLTSPSTTSKISKKPILKVGNKWRKKTSKKPSGKGSNVIVVDKRKFEGVKKDLDEAKKLIERLKMGQRNLDTIQSNADTIIHSNAEEEIRAVKEVNSKAIDINNANTTSTSNIDTSNTVDPYIRLKEHNYVSNLWSKEIREEKDWRKQLRMQVEEFKSLKRRNTGSESRTCTCKKQKIDSEIVQDVQNKASSDIAQVVV